MGADVDVWQELTPFSQRGGLVFGSCKSVSSYFLRKKSWLGVVLGCWAVGLLSVSCVVSVAGRCFVTVSVNLLAAA